MATGHAATGSCPGVLAITPGLSVQISQAGSPFRGSLPVSRSPTPEQLRREAHVVERSREAHVVERSREAHPAELRKTTKPGTSAQGRWDPARALGVLRTPVLSTGVPALQHGEPCRQGRRDRHPDDRQPS